MKYEITIDDHSGEEPYSFESTGENFADALDHPDVLMELQGRDSGHLTIEIIDVD